MIDPGASKLGREIEKLNESVDWFLSVGASDRNN
jgi:hypothetical protein